jgi:Nuclear fragile X mental retardation-interacting protein 1 (NUFIP1)
MAQYRNEYFSLSTPAEIRGWIADRKKWYPTQARIAEKKALEQSRREKLKAVDEERRKKSQEARLAVSKAKEKEKLEREERQLQLDLRKIQRRRQLLNSAANDVDEIKGEGEPAIHIDPDADDGTTSPRPSSEVSKTVSPDIVVKVKVEEGPDPLSMSETYAESNHGSYASSGSDSDNSMDSDKPNGNSLPDSDASDDEACTNRDADEGVASDDEAPEVLPSKTEVKTEVKTEQRPKIEERKPSRSPMPCKYFIRDGHCRRGDCRFAHEIDSGSGRQLTLFERVSLTANFLLVWCDSTNYRWLMRKTVKL